MGNLPNLFAINDLLSVSAHVRGSVSVSGTQLFVFKTMFYVLVGIAAIWLITVGALIYSLQAFNDAGAGGTDGRTESVANGAIYMAILALSVVFACAIIFPGLLLLQPVRLWKVLKAERSAVTPRQRFRGARLQLYRDEDVLTAWKLYTPAHITLRSLPAHAYLLSFLHLRFRLFSRWSRLLLSYYFSCLSLVRIFCYFQTHS